MRLFLMLLLVATTANAGDLIIPAASHAPGVNATFFQTDVRIVNLAAVPATVEISWLPSNQDNTNPKRESVMVGMRASLALDDVVQTIFGVTNGGGALRLTSAADLAVTSRTFTTSGAGGCGGTFGQYIPAIPASSAMTRSVLPNIRLTPDTTSGFRSNIGVVNPSATAASVSLRLRTGSGTSVKSAAVTVPPFGHTQAAVRALFETDTLEGNNFFIELDSSVPIIGYASVIDNVSADPIFIAAVKDSGTPLTGNPVILARAWAFVPNNIEVSVGSDVTLVFRSEDIHHGIAIDGVGDVTCFDGETASCGLQPGKDVTVRFKPTTAGTFRFYCTSYCGLGHWAMDGAIVVK